MRTFVAVVCLAFATHAAAQAPNLAGPGSSAPATGSQPAPAPMSQGRMYGKSSGVIPGMVIGPKFALLPVPYVYGLGLEAKFKNLIGVGLDYNAWPSLEVKDAATTVKLAFRDVSLAGRIFPWQGRFYVGAALGQRTFEASANERLTGQEVAVEVKSTYLAPEVGWRFVWDAGFFMGIDLGYQLVLSSDVNLTLPSGTIDLDDKKEVEDAGDQIGKVGFPVISLLQLGWYF